MGVKILVPVSGGKDSQATLKLAVQEYPRNTVLGLFCDTQFEHPLTYQHINHMSKMYDIHIERITSGSVRQQIIKHRRFPGGGARFCTEELKIWPTKRFCKQLAESQGSRLSNKKKKIEGVTSGGFEVWYGMRNDESPERKKRYSGKVCDELYDPHDVLHKYPRYLHKLGISFRLAILDWSRQDVIDYVGWNNLNPLYHDGFPRVGCFPCLASGDKWKSKAFKYDSFGSKQFKDIVLMEKFIGKTCWTSKSGKEENGCAVCHI